MSRATNQFSTGVASPQKWPQPHWTIRRIVVPSALGCIKTFWKTKKVLGGSVPAHYR